ncbi:hypothetical protein M5D96_003504, partial [Drosophila gunungcola]
MKIIKFRYIWEISRQILKKYYLIQYFLIQPIICLNFTWYRTLMLGFHKYVPQLAAKYEIHNDTPINLKHDHVIGSTFNINCYPA